jgi:hypothetical protein
MRNHFRSIKNASRISARKAKRLPTATSTACRPSSPADSSTSRTKARHRAKTATTARATVSRCIAGAAATADRARTCRAAARAETSRLRTVIDRSAGPPADNSMIGVDNG